MKHSIDPFEVALLDEEEELLPCDVGLQTPAPMNLSTTSTPVSVVSETSLLASKDKCEDGEEGGKKLDLFTRSSSKASHDEKANKRLAILSQFTEEQMARYVAFRRSSFNYNMMQTLVSMITGVKISSRGPVRIVVATIAKKFVGELVETGRIVVTERNESGPIRPCHVREAFGRLKLEGKVPKRYVPRLFC